MYVDVYTYLRSLGLPALLSRSALALDVWDWYVTAGVDMLWRALYVMGCICRYLGSFVLLKYSGAGMAFICYRVLVVLHSNAWACSNTFRGVDLCVIAC